MGNSDRFSIKDRVACVTGASSGLGQTAATALAEAGAKVVAVARREDRLRLWSDEVCGQTTYIAADLSDRSNLKALADQVSNAFGPPDIVVHAAGLNARQFPDEITDADWDATIDVNLSVPFFLSREFVPAMRGRGWGRIVTFASLQSVRAFPGGIAYGASKGGIAQLTRAMAEAWSQHGINVNAIGPGFFPTELTAPVFDDPKRAQRNADQTCIGRNGEEEDLIGPLLFLCSEASRFVTGQILMVDGGFTAK